MLKYEEFKKQLLEKIREKTGKNAVIRETFVERKNGKRRQEILYIPENNDEIITALSLGGLYAEYLGGKSLDRCTALIVENCGVMQRLAVSRDFHHWDRMKNYLRIEAVNAEWDSSFLENTPHRKILDLAVYCRFVFKESGSGIVSLVVKQSMLSLWGITEEQMWEQAEALFRKERFEVVSTGDFIRWLLRYLGKEVPEEEEGEENLYMLTNRFCNRGASGMFRTDILEKIGQKHHCGLYVVPSSVNEVMLMPDKVEVSLEEMKKCVADTNRLFVKPEERLSDSVYHYELGSGKVVIAG